MKISNNKNFKVVKLYLVAGIICISTSYSWAQSTTEKNFKLGFTTSPTFGWINYESGSNTKSDGLRPGFSYGVLADFGFSNNYFFSTGLTLTTVNANTKTTVPTNSTSALKIQYVELPISLKLKSNEKSNNIFYGQFGLTTGIKTGAKRALENQDDVDISKEVNLFRLGLIIGGGSEYRIGQNLKLLTGISYNNGFTDVFDTNVKAKNSYLTLNVGVFF